MDTHSEAIIFRSVWVLNEHRFLARLWYRRGIKRNSISRVNTHIDSLNVLWIQIQYPPLLLRIRIRQPLSLGKCEPIKKVDKSGLRNQQR